jgi:hypothetical protein
MDKIFPSDQQYVRADISSEWYTALFQIMAIVSSPQIEEKRLEIKALCERALGKALGELNQPKP